MSLRDLQDEERDELLSILCMFCSMCLYLETKPNTLSQASNQIFKGFQFLQLSFKGKVFEPNIQETFHAFPSILCADTATVWPPGAARWRRLQVQRNTTEVPRGAPAAPPKVRCGDGWDKRTLDFDDDYAN